MRGLHRQSRAGSATTPPSARGHRRLGSVQQGYVAAEAVVGDVLVLATPNPLHHDYRAVLEVSSVNYALKTVGEQEAILAGYRAFLNGLTFPIQLLVQVRPLDLIGYAEQIRATQRRNMATHTHVLSSQQLGTASGETREPVEISRVHSVQDAVDDQQVIWRSLAEDEARYVLDLAARKTLLERLFYLVLPADEQSAFELSTTNGSGLLLSRSLLPGAGFLPFPGRGRRRQAARTRTEDRATRILDLRAQSVARELGRIGLETRRLAGAELAAVYHHNIAPDATRRHPIGGAHLAAIGVPSLSLPAQHEMSVDVASAIPSADADETVFVADANNADDGNNIGEPNTKQARRPWRKRRKASAARDASATWGDLADLLAPAAVEVTRDDVRLDDIFCRTLAVVGYPRHVYHGWLGRLIDLDEPLDLVLHLHPQSTATMIRQLSHRLVQLHSSRLLNEERGRLGAADLGVAYEDVERTRERLQRGDERIFATSLYLHVRAPAAPGEPARQLLEERVARVEQELANQQLVARPATFEQDLGLLSCLPEGRDRLMRRRLLDTSSLATAFPFLSNSLSMPDGILFGTTANGSPVFLDIFSPLLENANQVLFAKSGAGKSYSCKIEALRSLVRGVDVYVVDPETEYKSLAEAVGGQTVRLAAGANQHLNPFDLPQQTEQVATSESEHDIGHGGDALADKVQSLHALLDLMLADRAPTGTVGLSQREKGLLDRALYEVYRRAGISSDPATHCRPAPLLRDLYEVLEKGACGVDETHLADRLHRYVHGSLSGLFAKPTNVELTNRLVVFDVRDMDAELRPLGLFLIADFVWTHIRRAQRPRLLIIDEAWTLMQYQEGGRFLAGMARRARKYYLGLITITQDAEDFLSSEHGRTVLANSSVQLLMKQDSSTIEAVTRAFQLSTSERQFLLGCHKGEGLLFARGGHVALQIGSSPLEHSLATTDPRELAEWQRNRSTNGATSPLAVLGSLQTTTPRTPTPSLATRCGSSRTETRADKTQRAPRAMPPMVRKAREVVGQARDAGAGDDEFANEDDESLEDLATGVDGAYASELDQEEI